MNKSMVLTAVVASVIAAASVSAGDKDPVTGPAFERMVAAQDTALQHQLADGLEEILGWTVAGPLDSEFNSGVANGSA